MSMLTTQADELRKTAAAMEELGREIGKPYGMSRGLIRTAQMMREAADTIESLRDRLHESYGQVPEQGERAETGERESYSRWHQLFGTPERAMRTLELLHVEWSDWCAVFSECRDCMFGRVDGDRVTCWEPDDFSLVEWLRGDA